MLPIFHSGLMAAYMIHLWRFLYTDDLLVHMLEAPDENAMYHKILST